MAARRLRQAIQICAAGLLLWACYDYGAFLRPATTVVAIAGVALGLLWILVHYTVREPSGEAFRFGDRAENPRPELPESLLLALAAFGALSALWSLDWDDSLRAAGILFGGRFYLSLGRHVGRGPLRARRALLLVLGATGLVVSILSVVGFALRWWRFTIEKDGVLAASGTLGYANALAGLLILTMAATIAFQLDRPSQAPPHGRGRSAARVALMVAALAPQLAALGLTRSRGAAAIVAVVVLVFLIIRLSAAQGATRRRRWVAAALAAALLGGLAAGGILIWREVAPQMAVSGLPSPDADPEDVVPMTSNSFRIKNWAAALEAAGQRPVLGYGLDTFYEAYAPFKLGGHTAYAHNVVIQHLVELGGLGTALVVAFLLVAALGPLRILIGPLREPRIPLLLGVQAFVLHNLIDLTWYFPALFFVFVLTLGLTLGRPDDTGDPRAILRASMRPGRHVWTS